MSRWKVLLTGLILGAAGLVYYYRSLVLQPFLAPSLGLPPFSLPPSQYKVMEMNDRLPSFKLATSRYNEKPFGDGDQAQGTVIDSLQLVKKCKQDPSLIVVDVGAFLGNHTSHLNKHDITRHYCIDILSSIFLSNNEEVKMI